MEDSAGQRSIKPWVRFMGCWVERSRGPEGHRGVERQQEALGVGQHAQQHMLLGLFHWTRKETAC